VNTIVHADDLDALDDHNPYKFWKDRDRKLIKDKFKIIPKNYYLNYKTNMMRDAHEISAAIVA